MNSIFVRIYGGILVALLIIGALTYAGVELVNDYRSQLYRERMARGTFYLMAEGYRERAGDDERQAWSRSLSRMFGAPVTLRDAGELGLSYRDGLHLQEGRVVLRGNPDSERVEVLFAVPDDPLYIRAVMSRLSEQQARATAMLVLDYLRARPANRQDQALADLNQHFGYPLTLLPRTELDLDVEQQRRLERDEVVFTLTDSTRRDAGVRVLVPVPGGERILVMGPLPGRLPDKPRGLERSLPQPVNMMSAEAALDLRRERRVSFMGSRSRARC